jgi:hypothetical protein
MIRIAITAAAFEAVAARLPGSVGFEREPTDNGERLIWLEPHVVNKLRYLRGSGESYSDVLLRLCQSSRRSGPLHQLKQPSPR